MEAVELYSELKKQQDHLQHRQQIIQVPFQIRQVVDGNGEGLLVVASQTSQGQGEIRVLDKGKLVKSLLEGNKDKEAASLNYLIRGRGSTGFKSEMLLGKINVRFPISSLTFNPRRPRQLVVSGLCDIISLDIKKDGTSENEKYIVQRSPQIISKLLFLPSTDNYIAYLVFNCVVVVNIDTRHQITFQHSSDDKIKDIAIIALPAAPGFFHLLAVDFNGVIFQHKFTLKDNGKIMLCS